MKRKRMIFALVVVFILFSVASAIATNVIMRYQVVAGSEDKAYLVDTATGAVWVLTHRTLPTGREPIAIPYKFIKISPKSPDFLMEKLPEPGTAETEK